MSQNGSTSASITALILVVVVLVFTVVRTTRKQERSYRTFCIRVENDRLVRRQEGYPQLEIAFAEITKLTEHDQGDEWSKHHTQHFRKRPSARNGRFDGMKDGKACAQFLKALQGGEKKDPLVLASALYQNSSLCVVFRADSPLVAVPAGCVALGGLACCAIILARSPHVESRTKRGLWWLIPVCLSIAVKMWFTLGK
jgi:hypothetical protein